MSDGRRTSPTIGPTSGPIVSRIGAALFLRTTRSVGLTEAGERFLARAKPAFEPLSSPCRWHERTA